MLFTELPIAGAWQLGMERLADERGHFARIWCEDELRRHGIDARIAQVNTGFSSSVGTLRGLHYQTAPHLESKLVRCLRGRVFDVLVDLRRPSPTYCRWFGMELSAELGEMLYVPPGCAHGYLTLEPNCELMYFASAPYARESARGVRYDDPGFSITWPRSVEVISSADRCWPDFDAGAVAAQA